MAKSKTTKSAPKKSAKPKAVAPKKQKVIVLSVCDRNEARREMERIFRTGTLNINERNALRRAVQAANRTGLAYDVEDFL